MKKVNYSDYYIQFNSNFHFLFPHEKDYYGLNN